MGSVLLFISLLSLSYGINVQRTAEDHLPDPVDPYIRKRLQCSACNVTAKRMFELVAPLFQRRAPPRTPAVVDALDGVCESLKDVVGLRLQWNRPTLYFSTDRAISRLRGNWVHAEFLRLCSTMIEEHEELISRTLSHLAKRPAEMAVSAFCQRRELGGCTPDALVGRDRTYELYEAGQEAKLIPRPSSDGDEL